MTRSTTTGISPFFIVSNVDRTVHFYVDPLGFESTFQEPQRHPFFAVLRREGAQLLVKSDAAVAPLPNCRRQGLPIAMRQHLTTKGARWSGGGVAGAIPMAAGRATPRGPRGR